MVRPRTNALTYSSHSTPGIGGELPFKGLGFPTANIEPLCHGILVPANGVYAVRVALADGSVWPGMLNIFNATIAEQTPYSRRAHLGHGAALEFIGGKDLYAAFFSTVAAVG